MKGASEERAKLKSPGKAAECIAPHLCKKRKSGPPAGNEVVAVWANGSATSLMCTVNQSSNTQCSDTNAAHSVTITAGQTISLRVDHLPASAGTLASMRASVQLH